MPALQVVLSVLGAASGTRQEANPPEGKVRPVPSSCPIPGPVTNAFIVLAPANMFNPDGKPSVPLPKFSKHLHGTESNDEQGSEGVTLRLGLHQQVWGMSTLLGRGRRRLGQGVCAGGCKISPPARAASAASPR